ncbi:MAG TPA: DUF3800 domain-containing protein [Thermoanaerobaculia bacterium]
MSYLLFLDESGLDQRHSPYEVLAGVAIRDQHLWDLVCQVREAELEYFGRRLSDGDLELKAKKLLKRKTFRLAAQAPPISTSERKDLTVRCLEKGDSARGRQAESGVTRQELTALAQTKLAFVEQLLELCGRHSIRTFASIVSASAPRPAGHFLRKDYAYLFERFYYFLEDQRLDELGLVIFDELERSQCHLLTEQMALYFRETAKGRLRAGRIIPEPFFVHSELTTAIQIADLVAYIVCWGVRFGSAMVEPRREELESLADLVCQLRVRTTREIMGRPDHPIWSFTFIDDLRPREER